MSLSPCLRHSQTLLSDGSKNPLPFQKLFSHLPRVFWPVDTCSQRSPSPRFPQSNSTAKTTKNSSSELLSHFQMLLSDGNKNPLLLFSFQKPFSYLPRVFWLVDTCSQRSASPCFPQSNCTPKMTKNSSSELLSKNPLLLFSFQKPFSYLPRVCWLVDTCSQRSTLSTI